MTQSSDPTGSEGSGENMISEGEIDETLKESFPASDPPQWTLGVESHAHPHPKDKADPDEEDEASE